MKNIFTIILTGVFLLTYCTKEDNAPTSTNQDPDPIISSDLTIGPAGGTIGLTDGSVVFEFPPNAVSSQTTITIEKISDPINDPWVLMGTTYKFGPEGIQFNQPVKLSLKYNASNILPGVTEEALVISKLEDTLWIDLENYSTSPATDKVSGFINGFSSFTVKTKNPVMKFTVGSAYDSYLAGAINIRTLKCTEWGNCDSLYSNLIYKTLSGTLNGDQNHNGCVARYSTNYNHFSFPIVEFDDKYPNSTFSFGGFAIYHIGEFILNTKVSGGYLEVLPPYYTAGDFYSALYLGSPTVDIEDALFSMVIDNPYNIPFNIVIKWYTAGKAIMHGGLPTVNSSSNVDYALLNCQRNIVSSGILFDWKCTSLKPNYVEGDSIVISDLNGKFYQLYFGALMQAFSEAHYSNNGGLIWTEAEGYSKIAITLKP